MTMIDYMARRPGDKPVLMGKKTKTGPLAHVSGTQQIFAILRPDEAKPSRPPKLPALQGALSVLPETIEALHRGIDLRIRRGA